jgi:hypothetical protein
VLFEELLPGIDGPLDLEAMLDALPISILRTVAHVARRALGLPARGRLTRAR